MIIYEDFAKLDLRVGTVKSAETVKGSEKLLKLQVELGEELGERQIIAGIAKTHSPEALEGMQIIVVVNLEPRKLMGFESQGMLLAGDSEGGPVLLQPEKEIKSGSKIK